MDVVWEEGVIKSRFSKGGGDGDSGGGRME